MLIRVVHRGGGPIDGTVEFDDESLEPESESDLYYLSRGNYEMTDGEMGATVQMETHPELPDNWHKLHVDELAAIDRTPTVQFYVVTQNEMVDGVRCVTFEISQDD